MKRNYSVAVTAPAAFAAVTAPDITIPFVPTSVLVIIEDTTAANTVEVSFDSSATHGKLIPGTVTGLRFENGRTRIWLKRAAGTPVVRVVAEG